MSHRERLFVYGTLKDRKVQKKVFNESLKGIYDSLTGYKKSKIITKKGTFPVIVPEKGDLVKGLNIFVTPRELKSIDKYEGFEYKKKKVVLKSRRKAQVYVKRNKN